MFFTLMEIPDDQKLTIEAVEDHLRASAKLKFETAKFFKAMDANDDGSISRLEFKQFFQKLRQNGMTQDKIDRQIDRLIKFLKQNEPDSPPAQAKSQEQLMMLLSSALKTRI